MEWPTESFSRQRPNCTLVSSQRRSLHSCIKVLRPNPTPPSTDNHGLWNFGVFLVAFRSCSSSAHMLHRSIRCQVARRDWLLTTDWVTCISLRTTKISKVKRARWDRRAVHHLAPAWLFFESSSYLISSSSYGSKVDCKACGQFHLAPRFSVRV